MADSSGGGKHFTCADDARLLTEANLHQPWGAAKVMEAWDQIAGRLRKCDSFPQDKDGKALSTRFSLLVKKHRDNTVRSMRKSGREEEYLEREQLLDDIDAKLNDFEALKNKVKAKKESEKRKRDSAGAVVLREAVGELETALSESTGSGCSDSDATPKKRQVLEAFLDKVAKEVTSTTDTNNSFKEPKLALLERQLEQQQQQLQQQQQQLEQQRQMQQQQMKAILKLVEKITRS